MHRGPKIALLFVIPAALLIMPTAASAVEIHQHHARTILKEGEVPVDTIRWVDVVDVAPADTDQDGVANRDDGCPDTAGSDGGCPPPPPPAPEPVPAAVTTDTGYVAPAPAPTTSSGGCPSYMAAEATSPSAVNPSSGAAGCYQILPSTAAANGCTDVGPSCAAAICASQGPSAWAASGANPCPYVEP